MFEYIKSDYSRSTNKQWSLVNYILLCASSKGVAAVKDYRLSHWLYKKGLKTLAKIVQNWNIKRNGCDIGYEAEFGKGFAIGHPVGVVVTGLARIKSNCTLMSGVTIGAKGNGEKGAPIIKDNVYIGTGAKLLGNITIGANVTIGANAVVLSDIATNSIAVGVPAKAIRKDGKDKDYNENCIS